MWLRPGAGAVTVYFDGLYSLLIYFIGVTDGIINHTPVTPFCPLLLSFIYLVLYISGAVYLYYHQSLLSNTSQFMVKNTPITPPVRGIPLLYSPVKGFPPPVMVVMTTSRRKCDISFFSGNNWFITSVLFSSTAVAWSLWHKRWQVWLETKSG